MRRQLFAITMTVVALTLAPAWAQDSCDAILADGVFEVKRKEARQDTGTSFLTWFCSNQSTSQKLMASGSGNARFPIGDLPVGLSARYDENHSNEYRSEACSLSNGSFTNASKFSSFSMAASEVLAKVWGDCMNRYGTWASIGIINPKTFAIYIRNNPSIGSANFNLIDVIASPGKLTCQPDLKSIHNAVQPGSTSIMCTRDDPAKEFAILPRIDGMHAALTALRVPPLGAFRSPVKSKVDEYEVSYHGAGDNDPLHKATFQLFCVPQSSDIMSFETGVNAFEGFLSGKVKVTPLPNSQKYTFHYSHTNLPDGVEGHFVVTSDGKLEGRLGKNDEYEMTGTKSRLVSPRCEAYLGAER